MPKEPIEVYVYVGQQGTANLRRGLERSVWGWKKDAIEKMGLVAFVQSLGEGDVLYIGHLGIGRIQGPDAQERSVSELVKARITGASYEGNDAVWDDEMEGVFYPYRVPFVVEEVLQDATNEDIGPEGIEALRLSAIRQGTPQQPGDSGVAMEKVFQEAVERHKKEMSDDEEEEGVPELPSRFDTFRWSMARVEQERLRKKKLGGRVEVPCDLCWRELPARLVHMAHIKRRSSSGHRERSDVNNLMFACVLGCDSLFEYGYIYVAPEGGVHTTKKVDREGLVAVVQGMGSYCSAFSDESAKYFAWHRNNIAQVGVEWA